MEKVGKKPTPPLFAPSQRIEDSEVPQSLRDLLTDDGDFAMYYGRLPKKAVSYYLIGILKGKYYQYKIGTVSRLEELKERFEGRGGKFKLNQGTNPFIWWKESTTELDIPKFEAKRIGKIYVGRFDDCRYKTTNGALLDFAKALGVSIEGY